MGKLARLGGVFGAVAPVVMAISASGSAAPTETSAQLFVGTAPGYTIAFKSEGPRVSVLALDAPIYCTFRHPTERLPATTYMFQGPTLMREGRRGLEAKIRPDGGRSSYVAAKLSGGKVTGTFALEQKEAGGECQTVGYPPADPTVAFKAVPYEAAATGAAKKPAKGEVPIYFGSEHGVEVLLQTTPERIEFRGSAPTICPVHGQRLKGGRAPLMDDVERAQLGEDGTFHHVFHYHGKNGKAPWSEAVTMSGTVEAGTVTGTFTRKATLRRPYEAPRECQMGPLPFSAARYLPAR